TPILANQVPHSSQPTRTKSSCNGRRSLGAMCMASGTAKESTMKRFAFVLLSVVLTLLVSHAGVDAKIRVVPTIPDLAARARNIGGDLLEVKSLATGVEDIHAVPIKPSFATLLNRADVVILMGLEAEHAFLPGLLEAARNPKILPSAPGYIDCSVYVV